MLWIRVFLLPGALLGGIVTSATRNSAGCGNALPAGYFAGGSTRITQHFSASAGDTTHEITLPASYDIDAPSPLLLFFHGWGGNFNQPCNAGQATGGFCRQTAPDRGWITLTLTGIGANAAAGSRANSWNTGFSTGSPVRLSPAPGAPLLTDCGTNQGPDGHTCGSRAHDYCYADCDGQCADNCWWTTCQAAHPQSNTNPEPMAPHS